MTEAPLSPPFKDLLLFLATAGVVVPLFTRLRIGATLGFLAAGVALGPFGLGALAPAAPWLEAITISDPEDFEQLAELGVAFLLFSIGLELSWERLRLMRRLVFGLGAVQLSAATAALAGGLLLILKDPTAALIVGAALALSSTAMAVPALARRHRLHAPAGRAAFSVLLFQDLSVAPLLAAVGLFAGTGDGVGPRTLYAFAPAALVLGALILGGRLLLRPLMKLVARAKSQEVFVAAALLVVIGSGVATSLAGLSMALGAFVAGLLLAETEYRHEVEVTIEPFAGLLLGLFFLSVGIRLDLSVLWEHASLVARLTLGLLSIKALVNLLACRLFGLSSGASFEAAMALAGGGEFAFVILGQASGTEIAPGSLLRPLLVAVTLSMFATPALVALGGFIDRRLSARGLQGAPEAAPVRRDRQVLIVGMGRVGRLVADILDERGLAWVAVDRDPRVVSAERRRGRTIHFGDGAKVELLKRLGLDTAAALVITMDTPDGVDAVVGTARHHRPDLVIVARARDDRHAMRLYQRGATRAVPEAFEASLQLTEALLLDLGEPVLEVTDLVRQRRHAFQERLSAPPGNGRDAQEAGDAVG